MEILGYILIAIVIGALFLYFKWSKSEVSATGKQEQRVTIKVEGTYNPNVIRAKKGVPLTVIFDRKEDTECSKKVIFEDFGISAELADFGKTEVKINPEKAGEFSFTCGMGMYQGKLIVGEEK